MPETDRQKWNTRYADAETGGEPASFLVDNEHFLPRGGRALDIAGGLGRHAFWLASHGLEVLLADVSDVGLVHVQARADAEGVAVSTLQIDLETALFPSGPWDMMVCTYYLHRPLYHSIAEELAPGGIVAIVHPTLRNLERHQRPSERFLLAEGELPKLLKGLEVLVYDEGWQASGRHEARAVARKASGKP